jgi:hypothetical protein
MERTRSTENKEDHVKKLIIIVAVIGLAVFAISKLGAREDEFA